MTFIIRTVSGFIAAAMTTYVVGTALNSQFVIAAHTVPVSLGDRWNMTAFDVSHMTLYFVVIVFGFAIAFAIAAILKRFLPGLAGIAYPIAGAAAIGAALGLMYLNFQTVPISGARSMLGFAAQMLAGGFGGWVFGRFMLRPVKLTR